GHALPCASTLETCDFADNFSTRGDDFTIEGVYRLDDFAVHGLAELEADFIRQRYLKWETFLHSQGNNCEMDRDLESRRLGRRHDNENRENEGNKENKTCQHNSPDLISTSLLRACSAQQ